jgi:Prenyltransferase and squalene oxidase repeat
MRSEVNNRPNGQGIEPLKRARAFLLAHQNPDGGWGYTGGIQSFTEPTCYALLALAGAAKEPHPATAKNGEAYTTKALAWFAKQQNAIGAVRFADEKMDADNWGTILASLALYRAGIGPDLQKSFLNYLLKARGNRINPEAAAPLRLDGDLLAWSWANNTASWVEPTAYAILALKAQGLRQHERVKIGEAYLLDRACYDGGWNYGNKEVLGVRLEPMPTNTAFALLALQDYPREHEVLRKSLAWFESELSAHQSTLTLSLGALCFEIYDRPVAPLLTRLLARQEADGSWRGNLHLTAVAALALAATAEKKNVFRV